jgi:hypothetical protein
MSLRQAAEEVIQGREARKGMKYISSNRKIAKKCDIDVTVVKRILDGLPTRFADENTRRTVLTLKAEHQKLVAIQQRNSLAIVAYRRGFTQSQIRAELERMGVEL